jgi:very-short-patch-repair endonuclease
MGVQYQYVDGVYESSTNLAEAEAIVEFALTSMASSPDRSLIIVTVNSEQRDLVDDIFYKKALAFPPANEFINKWKDSLTPFDIKNLEKVQGDERDIVLISTVYGKSKGENGTLGPVYQRFGPITGKFGHRRLNVLFTRAKYLTRVFTSLKPSDIQVKATSNEGVKILKSYLAYAEAGGRMLSATGTHTAKEPDSDFEIMVANALRMHGYQVQYQVGVAGFFIDLGISKEGSDSEFIAGVECDGATYHSAKFDRDRDKLRQEILEGMNWKIYRVWSTDWFKNPGREAEKLIRYLEKIAS